MIGIPKGKQVQICSSYPPEIAEQLQKLIDKTRVPLAVYMREAVEDLLKKHAAILRKAAK